MILDGKATAIKRKEVLKEKVKNMEHVPSLCIVQVGDVPSSTLYIKKKREFGEEIGVKVEVINFGETASTEEVVESIEKIESEGILVQLPLPVSMDKEKVLSAIPPTKDVDGLSSDNYTPATTKGISILLEEYGISVKGKKVTVVGYSDLVGKPTEKWLKEEGADVTVCDIDTEDLGEHTRPADIIVTAVGKPGLIGKGEVSEGQVVIDVGTTFVDGKLKGDVDFDEVKDIVEYITPVPGGVGPMTVVGVFEGLVG
ncbi:MAG: methylenetetrahydrofolate dehydrogenase (NADP+)/methenyltetrahydrofolate cyclohydrolase [Candidatus Paceibacteria bacterium]|jgi:methylenetetrahydrofolate dehydrogenase (NADP+)/methenyltetrahydrofolate cyclohydrolase